MEAVNEEKAQAPDDSKRWVFPTWTREYLDLIKKACTPKEINDVDFALFIEQCRRAELDPIMGQADCVPRKTKVGEDQMGKPIYVTRWVFQPREAGMLARADRFDDYGGLKAAAVYENDEFQIDEEAGTVVHKWSAKNRGKLLGAWCKVTRHGRETTIEWCDLAAYNQGNSMWGSKPHTMIVKCARSAGLRRTYPNTFGDSYIAEEMPAGVDQGAAPALTDGSEKLHQTVEGTSSKTEKVAERVAKKAAETRKAAAEPEKAKEPAPTPPVEKVATPTVPLKPVQPTYPTARFGRSKEDGDKRVIFGRALSDLTVAELELLLKIGPPSIEQSPNASWVPTVRDNLVEIAAELKTRETKAAPPQAEKKPGTVGPEEFPSEREPGSDDGEEPPPS